MNELNKKLLYWAGFREKDGIWSYPDGRQLKIFEEPELDLNACYEHLINPREDILWVGFSYRTRYPELEVKCRITMRSWHPDRTKGRVAFDGIAPKGKPALAFCKAMEQLIDAETKGGTR